MPHSNLPAAALLAALTGAGALTYAALSAQSQLFGKLLIAGSNPSEIALTFDDGPNDLVTERILDLLARHNVRASFFFIGRYVRQRPHIARTVASAGHLIGNHTMTHPWLAWQSASRIREELASCNAAIEDAIGAPIHFFRAPHGARRPVVFRIAHELRLTPVQWNILPGDWKPIDAREIADRTLRSIQHNQRRNRGSNIVLHDGGQAGLGQPRQPTIDATSLLLQQLTSQPTARFVTVDAWT
jgi:peptidoglycan/xylan/chitin deacetylase (PgdA/CDA1 family)